MEYSTEIDINLPLTQVIELFDNPDNFKHWQPTFVSLKLINGEGRKQGTKSQLTYRRGKKATMEMTETITKRDLPKEFSCTYEGKGVFNIQKNEFIDMGKGKTRWKSETKFRFSGTMKIIAFFLGKKGFQKETMKFHRLFKEFAEKA